MALYYHPILLLIILILSVLFLFRVIRTRSQRVSRKLPPGPWELPVLGGIHHLLGSQLPHRALQKMAQKYGPIMHMRLGEVSAIIISSAEVARDIFKTHDVNFSDRSQTFSLNILSYGFKDLIFTHYGEHWRQLRKICVLELFSLKRVQSFQFIREEEVLNLVQSICSANGSPINLSNMLYSITNHITTRSVLGNKRNKHQEAYLEILNEMTELSGGFSLADLFPSLPLLGMISGLKGKLLRCHRKVDEILDHIIQEHKQTRMMKYTKTDDKPVEEDLLDVLLKMQEEGGGSNQFQLSDECIKALIFDIFGAGSETSANTMEWTMTELVRNPNVMKKVQSEVREVIGEKANMSEEDVSKLNYLKLVVKEALRLHMPAPLLIPRECRDKCQVLGYQIPFGVGRRICPGMSFGLASMELALAQLLYHFDWKMPNGGDPCDLDVEETFGTTVRKKSNLILCAVPRNSCTATM